MLSDEKKKELRELAQAGALSPQYRKMSYDSASACYINGGMSELQWELYRYLWRNSVVRFSDTAMQFEDDNYFPAV
jgi:hypothetical protein